MGRVVRVGLASLRLSQAEQVEVRRLARTGPGVAEAEVSPVSIADTLYPAANQIDDPAVIDDFLGQLAGQDARSHTALGMIVAPLCIGLVIAGLAVTLNATVDDDVSPWKGIVVGLACFGAGLVGLAVQVNMTGTAMRMIVQREIAYRRRRRELVGQTVAPLAPEPPVRRSFWRRLIC